MKVKDIVKAVCKMLDKTTLASAVDSNTVTTSDQAVVNKFIEYFNNVQDEIASEFFPVRVSEIVSATDNIDYVDLEGSIVKIVSIKDAQGNVMPFREYPDCVVFKGDAREIVYEYSPDPVSNLTDDIISIVPVRVYCYGILRDYYLYEGLVDRSVLLEERFKNSLEALIKKDRNIIMPAKQWL